MENFVKEMYCNECVKRGDFTLSSGAKSNLYIDCRRLSMHNELLASAVRHLSAAIGKIIPSHRYAPRFTYGAVPMGGIPFLAGLLMTSSVRRGFYWRSEVKSHGTRQYFEGFIDASTRSVVLIDDVATSGRSIINMATDMQALFPMATVFAAVVLVDREEGARSALADLGIPLVSVLTKSQLLEQP